MVLCCISSVAGSSISDCFRVAGGSPATKTVQFQDQIRDVVSGLGSMLQCKT